MYIPDHFKETDPERLEALIREYPFGSLITVREGLPVVNHLPFLYEARNGGVPRFFCHLARTNPQWRDLVQNPTALIVFQGPHAYISPSWYVSPGVPTWNYAAVHIVGKARLIADEASLEKLLGQFTAVYESKQQNPWTPNLSGEQRAKLLGAIVGFEIEAQEIRGKFKLSQNRPIEDQYAVIDQLSHSPLTSRVAKLMKENLTGES